MQHIRGEYRGLHEFGRLAPRPPLYGIYEVDSVVKNGVKQPPLLTDATRWKRLAVSNRGARVRLATDSLVPMRIRTDSTTRLGRLTGAPL